MRGIMGEFSDVLLEQLDLEDLLREINGKQEFGVLKCG